MKLSFILLLSILVCARFVSAAAPIAPESLPVFSKAAIADYAISAAQGAYVQLYGETMVSVSGDKQFFQLVGSDADDLVTQIKTLSFDAHVYDVAKPVRLWGYLSNTSGDLLFYADDGYITTENNGVNTLKIKDAKLRLRLNWEVPIVVPGATDAYIAYKGEDGNEWRYDVRVMNGKLYFPRSYAGVQGSLVLTIDGSQFAYNLGTGMQIPLTTITGGIAVSEIENHIIGTDKGLPSGQVLAVSMEATPPAANGAYWEFVTPPTAKLTITSPIGTKRLCFVSFSIKAGADLGPVKAWAHRLAESGRSAEELEYSGTITTKQVGDTITVTAAWYLDNTNDQNEGAGSRWSIYFEIGGYEVQAPPVYPYYGTGTKG